MVAWGQEDWNSSGLPVLRSCLEEANSLNVVEREGVLSDVSHPSGTPIQAQTSAEGSFRNMARLEHKRSDILTSSLARTQREVLSR